MIYAEGKTIYYVYGKFKNNHWLKKKGATIETNGHFAFCFEREVIL